MIKAPTETRFWRDVRRCLRHKPTYTHGMDGATVAVRCEGLPDDVVERLQRKVMEQARELSALRKSEAAAQAELDRALLGSPGRARSPSPDRALRRRRRRRRGAARRGEARGRRRAGARDARRGAACAQDARGPPEEARRRRGGAEERRGRLEGSRRRPAEACAQAAADAKRACHGRLDALEGRVQQAIAAGAAEGAPAADAGASSAAAAAAAFGALRAEGDAALRDLRAAAEEAVAAPSRAAPRTGPRCSARPTARRPPPPPLLR